MDMDMDMDMADPEYKYCIGLCYGIILPAVLVAVVATIAGKGFNGRLPP
jgi:hypothetical protein